jgi:hypothetical protein
VKEDRVLRQDRADGFDAAHEWRRSWSG